jgi:hypothetical protein
MYLSACHSLLAHCARRATLLTDFTSTKGIASSSLLPNHVGWLHGYAIDNHGECDMMLIQGLRLARTVLAWKFVFDPPLDPNTFMEMAVVQDWPGEDVLDIHQRKASCTVATMTTSTPAQYMFTILVAEHQIIIIGSFKDFVSIKFKNGAVPLRTIDSSSHGDLIGTFYHLATLGPIRYSTVIEDENDHGQECELQPAVGGPPLTVSNTCFGLLNIPTSRSASKAPQEERRRLSETVVSQEAPVFQNA